MASYEVDPDSLFSDNDDDGSPPPRPASPVKRPRIPQHASTRAPTLGLLNLTMPGPPANLSGGRAPSRPPATAIAPPDLSRRPPAHHHQRQPARSSRMYSGPGHHPSQLHHAPPRHAPPRHAAPRHVVPRHAHAPPRHVHHVAPFGRGRGATLPAHVTRSGGGNLPPRARDYSAQPTGHVYGAPPPSITPAKPPPKKESGISSAASILPTAHRERLLSDTKKKDSERKRPGAARRAEPRQVRSAMAEERDRALIRENVRRAQAAKPSFTGLESLMKTTKRSAGQGLIRLNSEREGERSQSKRKRVSETEFYAGVTMTKEMREREERDRLKREQKVREERERVHDYFRDLREHERHERTRLIREWQKVETVAAGMRDSYRLDRAERMLFHDEEDRGKKDTLEYLGLKTKSAGEDEFSANLLTVKVIEI